MSHVRAVQDALLDGVDRLLLLEDDVVFHARAPQWLDRLMSEVPEDWDQLYLGGQHLKEAWPVKEKPFIWKARNVNRTHAYALQRRVYSKGGSGQTP
jgi:GR25 family glycosyltransferase involved in LPS biosynthesis